MHRIAEIAAMLRATEADGVLLMSEVHLTYAVGETALEGKCLILRDETALLITDGRYIERAAALLEKKGFAVSVRPAGMTDYEYLTQLLAEHGVDTLLFEDDAMTLRQYERLKTSLPQVRWLPLGEHLTLLRAQKSAEEIACMQQAQRIAEQALTELLPTLHEGITEREAAAMLDYLMALGGSEQPSFQTILLFGERASMPHGVPESRKLRRGDVILIDFGAVYRGYHSDMTRTFVFGEASEKLRHAYDAVLRAQEAAIAQAREGLPCCVMHEAAANTLAEAGLGGYFTHALGHSVGLEIHEAPSASPRCEQALANGVVMTVEPGVYLPGEFGIRIEDMVVIQGDTPRNLTTFPKYLQIL